MKDFLVTCMRGVILLCAAIVLLLFAIFIIGFGEYMATSTGNILWMLWYTPHILAFIYIAGTATK